MGTQHKTREILGLGITVGPDQEVYEVTHIRSDRVNYQQLSRYEMINSRLSFANHSNTQYPFLIQPWEGLLNHVPDQSLAQRARIVDTHALEGWESCITAQSFVQRLVLVVRMELGPAEFHVELDLLHGCNGRREDAHHSRVSRVA